VAVSYLANVPDVLGIAHPGGLLGRVLLDDLYLVTEQFGHSLLSKQLGRGQFLKAKLDAKFQSLTFCFFA
jgi:hypothetical protein